MPLDYSMKTAMEQPHFVSALLFEIILPDHTIRLLDGAGEVHYGENIYRGSDPVFGSIKAVDPLQEQVGTEAPFLRIMFLPQDSNALAALTDPARQGAPVNIYWAVIGHNSGQIVGEPYHVFAGGLDAAEADIDRNETSITMDVSSAWDLLFINGEGLRLNNAQHLKTWAETTATERGFEFVVAIQRNEPWGYDGPRPAIVADVINGAPSTGGGGGNSGGGSVGVGSGGGGYGGGGGGWMQDRTMADYV
jgi:uncharacterized membrane protein YgcG